MLVPKHHLIETTDGQKYDPQTIWDKVKQTIRLQNCMVDGLWGCALIGQDTQNNLLYLFASRLNVDFIEQF